MVLDIDHTLVDATSPPPACVVLRPHLADFLKGCMAVGFEIYLYTQATESHARRCIDAINLVMPSNWIAKERVIIAEQTGSVVSAKGLDNQYYDNRCVVDATGSRPMELIIDDNYSLAREVHPHESGPNLDRTAAGHWRAADQNNLITISAFSASSGRVDDHELMNRLDDVLNAKCKFKDSLEAWMKKFREELSARPQSEDFIAKMVAVFCNDEWTLPPSMAVIVPTLVKERMQQLQSHR